MTTSPAPVRVVRPRPLRAMWIVLVVGTLSTIALTALVEAVHRRNEDRLLEQRTREAAAVLQASLPGIQTPLASIAELAEATAGEDVVSFQRLAGPSVATGRPYASVSIWRVGDAEPIAVAGVEPLLASRSAEEIAAVVERAVATDGLSVFGLLEGPSPRLGYGFTSTLAPIRFLAYAEVALPPDRRSAMEDSAFIGLDFALYLGEREDAAHLVSASVDDLPLQGRRERQAVAFGDTQLLLVMTASSELGGPLMALLPMIVALVGAVGTGATAVLVARLTRRRAEADRLAAENELLYRSQRTVAKQLQQSLLPAGLPSFEEFEVSVRYQPADADLDIGGDWYDAVEMPDGRALFVIGDVSGHGLQAATSMAALRYAIRAFASQGDPPGVIVAKLDALIDVARDGHFATVLCVAADRSTRTIEVANAGHPPPLLIEGAGSRFVTTAVSPPIGVHAPGQSSARTVSIDLPADGVLLLFTDGLFERRRETIDVGLERLRGTASTSSVDDLDAFLDTVLRRQRDDDARDDTALLGIRWRARSEAVVDEPQQTMIGTR